MTGVFSQKIWGSGQALAETGLALSDNVLKLNDGSSLCMEPRLSL